MVNIVTVRKSNANFAAESHAGLVCVFAGATSGIGAATLARMVTMLQTSTFYVIGRSAVRFSSQQKKLEDLNPTCKIVFLEAEVSFLSEVDAVCKQISAATDRVDYLYMSPGIFPLNVLEYTKEGLEPCFALSYYSRMRLTSNLLPLLLKSPHPRVLSVLNGGKEKPMNDEDLGLEKNCTTRAIMAHTITMNSLAFEHLAKNDKAITFLHAAPGLVKTEIFSGLPVPVSTGVLRRVVLVLIQRLLWLLQLVLGVSPEESGERQAFNLTSDRYGPGAWRISQLSEEALGGEVMEQYRERAGPERVWEHTMCVFERALTGNASDN